MSKWPVLAYLILSLASAVFWFLSAGVRLTRIEEAHDDLDKVKLLLLDLRRASLTSAAAAFLLACAILVQVWALL